MNETKEISRSGYYYSNTIRGRLANSLNVTRAAARKKNLAHDLDLPFLLELFEQQEGKCYYTGQKMSVDRKGMAKLQRNPLSPSLERIDPEKGYIKGNVVLTTWAVNRAKGNLSLPTFIKMCKAVAARSKNIGRFWYMAGVVNLYET